MTSTPGGVAEAPETTSTRAAWVIFEVGGHAFGLPIQRIREITAPRWATRLPGCGPEVRGLVALRGRSYTVFDLAPIFGLEWDGNAATGKLLLVEHRERVVGFAVDNVLGVAHDELGHVAVDRAALRSIDVDRPDVEGLGTFEGRAFVAVDADPILDRLLA